MLLQEIVMSKTMTRKSKIRNNKEEKEVFSLYNLQC